MKNLHTTVEDISITLKIDYTIGPCIALLISISYIDYFFVSEVSGRSAGFVPSCKDGCNRPTLIVCPAPLETECPVETHFDVVACQCVAYETPP